MNPNPVKIKGASACKCCEGTGKAFNAIDAEWSGCLYCGGSGRKRGQPMTDKQPDAEAIAALDAFYGVDDSWKGSERDGFIAGMRRALDAAAALSRPLPGVVEGCEPSDSELSYSVARAMLANLQLLPMEGGEHGAIMQSIAPDMNIIIRGHVSLTELARSAIVAIDLAPRVAASYARGVEDAAKMREALERISRYRIAVGTDDYLKGVNAALHEVRVIADCALALLPKEPATEDAREKEAIRD